MLVAGLLAAALGQPTVQIEGVDCTIEGYSMRLKHDYAELCCSKDGSACYGEQPTHTDYCSISHYYRCCGYNPGQNEFGITAAYCQDKTKAECDADPNFEWCDTNEPTLTWEPGGCDIQDHKYRGVYRSTGVPDDTATVCCTTQELSTGNCYSNPLNLCIVSTDTHRCCALTPGGVACLNLNQDECNSDNVGAATFEWCPDTDDTTLCTSELRPVFVGKAEGTFCDLAEIPNLMTVEAICSATTEDHRCCYITTADTTDSSTCYANFDHFGGIMYRCKEEITTYNFDNSAWGVGTAWSVCCPGGPCPTSDSTSSSTSSTNEPAWTWEKGGCDIPKYEYRGTDPGDGLTFCCTTPTPSPGDCYSNPGNLCIVSTDTNRCCLSRMGIACANLGQHECTLENSDGATTVEWCPDTDTTLPPAAIAGIVVGAVVIVALAAYVVL